MSICDLCEQDKEKAYSCLKRIEGQIPFGDEMDLDLLASTCPDCGIGTGGFHHPVCRVEGCPKCHGKVAFCVCEIPEDYHGLTARTWWTRLTREMQRSVADGT